jgi:hypothetical protein
MAGDHAQKSGSSGAAQAASRPVKAGLPARHLFGVQRGSLGSVSGRQGTRLHSLAGAEVARLILTGG